MRKIGGDLGVGLNFEDDSFELFWEFDVRNCPRQPSLEIKQSQIGVGQRLAEDEWTLK